MNTYKNINCVFIQQYYSACAWFIVDLYNFRVQITSYVSMHVKKTGKTYRQTHWVFQMMTSVQYFVVITKTNRLIMLNSLSVRSTKICSRLETFDKFTLQTRGVKLLAKNNKKFLICRFLFLYLKITTLIQIFFKALCIFK